MFPLVALAGLLIALPWDWIKGSQKRDKKSRTTAKTVYFVLICGLFLMRMTGYYPASMMLHGIGERHILSGFFSTNNPINPRNRSRNDIPGRKNQECRP